jgi:hypothetical protein
VSFRAGSKNLKKYNVGIFNHSNMPRNPINSKIQATIAARNKCEKDNEYFCCNCSLMKVNYMFSRTDGNYHNTETR